MANLQQQTARPPWSGVASLFLVGVIVGSLTSSLVHENFANRAREANAEGPSLSVMHPPLQLPSFAGIAGTAAAAVVNISCTRKGESAQRFTLPGLPPFTDKEPRTNFFQRFFGELPSAKTETNVGSGFIISPDGEIITNRHVIENADQIAVRLASQAEYAAEVIGVDNKSDLALLKIQAEKPLPTLPLGQSAAVAVGDWVIAIGNPFGLEQTVTFGIVSAKGRVIGAGPYDDFIQTDASINPGNSGGPLLNVKGEVVGVSSAIFSGLGVNIGIGFATPIDIVKVVVTQLKEHGEVIRGWIGLTVRTVPLPVIPTMSFPQRNGALVIHVTKGGPAEKAGLKTGDIIIAYNGARITNPHQLPLLTADTPVGTRAEVALIRELKPQTVTVTIEKLMG